MTGGRNAPSDGEPKTTIDSFCKSCFCKSCFCKSCADAGASITAAINAPRPIDTRFITLPPAHTTIALDARSHSPRQCTLRSDMSSCRAADRLLELLSERHEEAPDQVFRHAGQDPLSDAGHEAADLPGALIDELRTVFSVGLDLEPRGTIAVAERAGARDLDVAGLRCLLVRQRYFAFERSADGRNAQLHLDLVRIGSNLGHGLAAGNAARQHFWIVERNPEGLDRGRDRFITTDIEFHGRLTTQTASAPVRR